MRDGGVKVLVLTMAWSLALGEGSRMDPVWDFFCKELVSLLELAPLMVSMLVSLGHMQLSFRNGQV